MLQSKYGLSARNNILFDYLSHQVNSFHRSVWHILLRSKNANRSQAQSVILGGGELGWSSAVVQLNDYLHSLKEELNRLTVSYEMFQNATLSVGVLMVGGLKWFQSCEADAV